MAMLTILSADERKGASILPLILTQTLIEIGARLSQLQKVDGPNPNPNLNPNPFLSYLNLSCLVLSCLVWSGLVWFGYVLSYVVLCCVVL
jgi:hypothetical protein